MQIAIIAEYNPLHKGHLYQLDTLRKTFGDACITVILGGTFSQRGEPYVAPPYIRAEAAVRSGADLVLELPFPFSAAPASTFARAGVEIAAGFGADMLAFGSECGSIEMLTKMRDRLDGEDLQQKVSTYMQKEEFVSLGKTRIYALAYRELYGENGAETPNDILAVEYLRAIRRANAAIAPYTVQRIGDYKSGEGGFPSASTLRTLFASGGFDAIARELPKAAEHVFRSAHKAGLFGTNIEKLSSAVLLKLHSAQNASVAYSANGLQARLCAAAREVNSIQALRNAAATKRYTDAEIARAILYALLDVTAEKLEAPVRYTKLLAMNARGREVLAKEHPLPIITKPSALEKLPKKARLQYEQTLAAERAYALTLSGMYDFLRQSPHIIL